MKKGAIPLKEGLIPFMVDLINFLQGIINTGIGPEGGEVESWTFLKVDAAEIRISL